MRAALSILGVVIVMAIVLFSAKKQMQAIAPPASLTPSSSVNASAPVVNRATPAAVKAEVQSAMDLAASAASAAQP